MLVISTLRDPIMKIKVINTFEKPSSIWLYSRNLCQVDSQNISVFDEYNTRTELNRIKRQFQIEVDNYFGGLFLKTKLKDEECDILHSADPLIPPLKQSETQDVTIRDNPYKLI